MLKFKEGYISTMKGFTADEKKEIDLEALRIQVYHKRLEREAKQRLEDKL